MVDKMRVAVVVALQFLAVVHCHNGIPVIIWGNSGTNLPAPLAAQATTSKEFSAKYLQPLSKVPEHNLVAFTQDKLSIDDITQNGDVYNAAGKGGNFHNLKSLLEEHPAVSLPSVNAPVDSITKLAKKFKGKVHHLNAPYDVHRLDLDPSGNNLIVTHLPASSSQDAVKNIDNILGSVSSALKSLGPSFTAMYTGSENTQAVESIYTGRHLLQSGAANSNYTFLNITCAYLYTTEIKFALINRVDENVSPIEWTLPNIDSPDMQQSSCVNSTSTANMYWSYNGTILNETVNINASAELWSLSVNASFLLQNSGYWVMNALVLDYDTNVTSASNVGLSSDIIWAPQYYSYHCSDQGGIPESANQTTGNYRSRLYFKNFQVQFQIRDNNQFGPANDCVGFFTIPIWSGLFVTLILVLILTYGMMMLASIKTMDRFDDPKGKTITVAVGE